MKNVMLFLGSLLLCGAVSCTDANDKDDDLVIIEPPYVPMFQFDEQGVPYRWETPTLSAEMQESLRSEFVGYGWKWMQTNEIDSAGWVESEGFYETLYGVGPISYYVGSDSTITSFYHSDATNQDGYLCDNYALSPESGILSNGTKPFGRDGGDLYLRIWSIYQLSGRWYISCVEPLCTRYNEIGLPHTVWGTSHYARMSDQELQQMRKQYDNYFGLKAD